MKKWEFDSIEFWTFLALGVAMIGIFAAATCEYFQRKRLYNECLADGKKPYQCHVIFESGYRVFPP